MSQKINKVVSQEVTHQDNDRVYVTTTYEDGTIVESVETTIWINGFAYMSSKPRRVTIKKKEDDNDEES